jgi:hypothetical protein
MGGQFCCEGLAQPVPPAARTIAGGTAPAEVRRMAATLDGDEALVRGWRARLSAAAEERGAGLRTLGKG